MAVKHSEQLAAATKRVLADRRWTLRQAERNTGVGYGTIQNMTEGRIPGAELIARWALAIGEDRNHWLRIAEYHDLVDAKPTRELVREQIDDYGGNPFQRAGFSDDGERWRRMTDDEREDVRRLMDRILANRGDPRDQG